jgi:D-2-hydroxyacid dehydrogenase (NADP+)
MPAPFALPFHPRHVVIGAGAHAAIAAYIRERRPDLEIRGAKFTDVTADDLAWADTYVGFKRPPAVASMGNVRWVQCTGAGVDSWLSPAELDRTILLTRSPESFGPPIAEWVVSRVFAIQQQLLAVSASQREHHWKPRDITMVAGTRAVVVGTGDVGRAVARSLTALGVEVTGVSRTGAPHPEFRAVHPVSKLADVVGDAQWIMLVVPDAPAARGIFSREVLSKCQGAVLLNAGRGSTLDEAALPDALDKGWLRGAALDVFTVEPLPVTSPLWDDPRIMISPHISGLTTVEGAGSGFLECVESLEQGRLPKWAVDRERGY